MEMIRRILRSHDSDSDAPKDDSKNEYDWIIGIVLMFLGSICTNLGNNLMSLGHAQQREINKKINSEANSPTATPLISQRKGILVQSITPVNETKESPSSPLLHPLDPLNSSGNAIEEVTETPKKMRPVFKAERRPSYGEPIPGSSRGTTGIERIISPQLPNKVERPQSAQKSPTSSKGSCRVTFMQSSVPEECMKSVDSSTDLIKHSNPSPILLSPDNKDSIPCQEDLTIDEPCEVENPKGTWWLVGTVIFVFGALVVFLSFGFAAQSLLAALESVQFVSNVFFAKYIHGELITTRIVWSTLSIVFGNILVVIFSSHASNRLTAQEVADIYINNKGFHAYLIISAALFFASYYIWKLYSKARMEEDKIFWRHTLVESLSYIVYMSLIGTQAVLHSKNLSMLMQHCIQDENQFATPNRGIVWAELFIWIIAAYLYCGRINVGLDLYPPIFFIPVQAVCFAFFTIVCGGIFFSEFHFTSVLQTVCFVLGIVLIFGGVCALAPNDVKLDGKVSPCNEFQEMSSTTATEQQPCSSFPANKYLAQNEREMDEDNSQITSGDGTLQTLEVDDLESCGSGRQINDFSLTLPSKIKRSPR